jgi:hypothetical protein
MVYENLLAVVSSAVPVDDCRDVRFGLAGSVPSVCALRVE